MAENESEGSDIEFDFDDGDDGYDPMIADLFEKSEWVRAMFEDEDEDDEEGDFEGFQEDWEMFNFRPVRLGGKRFTRVPGVKPDVGILPDSTPLFCFEKVFTDEMWDRLVTETNRYAVQKYAAAPAGPTRPKVRKVAKWIPVTLKEMKTFVGLCMAMGILKLSQKRDYWRGNRHVFKTNFGHYMSRDRFDLIWR